MKKKKKRDKIKVRRTWNIDPATRVHDVDTDYKRSRDKRSWQQEVDEALFVNDNILDDFDFEE